MPTIVARRAAGLLLTAVAVYGGVHLVQVHQQSWQWRWTPSAASPLVTYRDRHYLRAEIQAELPPDSHPLGHTAGGGQIFGPAENRFVPTSITVRDGARLISYELSGGP